MWISMPMWFIHAYILFKKKNSLKITLSSFSKLWGENNLVKPVRLLPLNLKSINLMQKYTHIIES